MSTTTSNLLNLFSSSQQSRLIDESAAAVRELRVENHGTFVAHALTELALRRLAFVGKREDIERWRQTAALVERIMAGGTVVGLETEIQELATVLLGLG